MRIINESNRRAGAILAFAMVPLSGLATDLYLPSFPQMAHVFQATPAQIQTTLAVFLISYGIGQFFAGTIMDSFGRYKPALISLLIFAFSNLFIIHAGNIQEVYIVRVIQGICGSFIAVSARTYFVDVYTGEKQKNYTAMLTIVWGTAPIIAPFFGGFLQEHFGWSSCFYFLSIYALVILILEGLYSGETLQIKNPFRMRFIAKSYKKILGSYDFSAGVIVLGLSYCMIMSFNMAVPFIVEKQMHLSPIVTGYCALFSGIALFFGGIIGRIIKIDNLFKKLIIISLIQCSLVIIMLSLSSQLTSLLLLMTFVMLIHLAEGVIYNLFFTYCLIKFPQNAGAAGGITSGGSYIVVSIAISGLMTLLSITSQEMLAVSYLILSVIIITMLLVSQKAITAGMKRMTKVKLRAQRIETKRQEAKELAACH